LAPGVSPGNEAGNIPSCKSHHRGQIALALKQNRLRLPDKVAINVIWYKGYFGEP
jgi:hypothetical protein